MRRILPLVLIVLCVCGCGAQTPEATATPEPQATQTPIPTAEPTLEPTAEPTPVPVAAPADEGERTVEIVSFESANGYTVSYDIHMFNVASKELEDVFMPSDSDAGDAISLSIRAGADSDYTLLTAEADARQSLLLARYTIETMDTPELFSSYECVALRASKGTNIIDCYLLAAPAGVFTLQLACPEEAADSYGAALWAMLETFAPSSND